MDPELQKAIDEMNKTSAELVKTREAFDEKIKAGISGEFNTRGYSTFKETEDTITETLSKLFVTVDEIKKMTERVALIEKNHNRIDEMATKDDDKLLHTRMLGHAMKYNFNKAAYSDEYKEYVSTNKDYLAERDLNTTNLTEGGIFVLPDVQTEIIKDAKDMSPVRTLARVSTTTSNEFVRWRRTDIPGITWGTERSGGSEGQMAYKKITIPIHDASVSVPVTSNLLEDSEINIVAEIQADIAISYEVGEGAAFVLGAGSASVPEGFMINANVVTTTAAESPTAEVINGDDFYNLMAKLHPTYSARGWFVMNRVSLNSVLKLKATDGTYLWQANLQMGAQATIAGKPYMIFEDMVNPGTTTNPVAFGDFSQGYEIVDKLGMTMLPDPYTSRPAQLFHFRKRMGGLVTQPNALTKLFIPS